MKTSYVVKIIPVHYLYCDTTRVMVTFFNNEEYIIIIVQRHNYFIETLIV